jgi:chromosome partitioning protein
MRKIAVALSKGGVGKTTTAVNLAAGLAERGQRVLLVDVDTQGQAGRALGLQPAAGLGELALGEVSAEQAIAAARPNLWLLAGGQSLSGLRMAINRREFGGEQTLHEALQPLADRYDVILLDTAPGWDTLTVNVLFFAEEVLSPVSLEVLTLQGLLDFDRNLGAIQKYHSQLELRYVLPTFLDRRVRKSEEILSQLKAHFENQICAPVRYNVRLSEAPGYGQTIFEYAPRSAGAEDYTLLTERILKDGGTQTNT